MDIPYEVQLAEARIRTFIRQTPLDRSLALSQATGCNVFTKLENLQITGSFKLRGALNKLLSLPTEQRGRGIVTASTGNHGAAVAYSLGKLGLTGIVFVPEHASPTKVEAIQRYGATVKAYGLDSADTEIHARQYADERGMVFVSPYNDPQVIGGQGTIGLELGGQIDRIDALFVPVGGGGLISGVAGYLKSQARPPQVFGCLPQNSPTMLECVKAGQIVPVTSLPTLSDGTAGGIEPGSITLEICQQNVDQYILVSEAEIQGALLDFIEVHHLLIEGASAVALAAFLKVKDGLKGKNVVVVLSGGNLGLGTLKKILN